MSASTIAPHEPTASVSPEQVAFFHENGFLAIDAITTPEELERLREIYDRLFSQRAGRERGDQFDLAGSDEEGTQATLPQILSPSRYAPELLQSQYYVNARHISAQLLGEDVAFQGEHAIFKPALYGAPTPWHQDEAYWNPKMRYNSLSVWMPLQEATPENGCLQFIPGSHKWEILPHRSIGGDTRVHGLEVAPEAASQFDASAAVPCPLPPGGATFHLNRTLHYAGPNNSTIPRRAYIIGFGQKQTPYESERSFPWNERKTTARDERARAASRS